MQPIGSDAPRYVPADLRLSRVATAKAVNSLSWVQQTVESEEGPGVGGTVLAVNAVKLGWDRAAWRATAAA